MILSVQPKIIIMEIQHQQTESEGVFYIDGPEGRLAEMQYGYFGDNMIDIYHTEVAEELQGQHIGKQLVNAAVDFARRKDLKIIPSCTFAKSVFDAEEGYQDVLAPSN